MSSGANARRRGMRLEQDRALVAASPYGSCWPDLQWKDTDGNTVLEGKISIDEGFGCPEVFDIRIVFDPNYPNAEPRVFEVGGRIPHIPDRHFYSDGRCCLWHWLLSPWKSNDPQALLGLLDQVVLFFERQLICDTTGKFPGPQLEHGLSGTCQAIVALLGRTDLLEVFRAPLLLQRDFPCNGACPCGSNIKYKKCHQPNIERIRRQVQQDELRGIFKVVGANSQATRTRARRLSPVIPAAI